ncbi:MAG: hypothetical protein ACI3Y0_12150 [Prevotella sp.]
MGGTVRDLSANQASPNAPRKEKHEQFTPIQDVNLRQLVLLRFEFGDFDWQETRTKSMYIMS